MSNEFRSGLAARGLKFIVVVTDNMVVFTKEPTGELPGAAERPEGTGGRPRKWPRLGEDSPRPVSLKDLATRTRLRKVTWREGTKGKLSGHFVWLRVWPGGGWATGTCAGAEPIWLLIERQADGKLKYAFSNLPLETTRLRAVRLWKSRWPVEQGYQQMKEELGLAHFEGHSWRIPLPRLPSDAGLRLPGVGMVASKTCPGQTGKKGIPSRGSLSQRSVAPCNGC